MARSGLPDKQRDLTRISVPERGHTDIGQDVWSVLQASRDFQRLHSEGVVEVVHRPLGKVRLKGTCYVGHAICGNILLDFCEKVEGALDALLGFASHSAFKLARVHAARAGLSDLVVLLVSQLLDAVGTYASSGRRFDYVIKRSVGPLAGGKLNITKTIRLRSRGLGHLLAFEKNVSTYRTPVNRVILAALSEVELLSQLVRLPDEILAKSRSLSMLFSDCRDHEVLFRERSYFAKEAFRLAEFERDELVRDMLSLASVILSHESFGSAARGPTGFPLTWFLNLERLFESTVRTVLGELCSDASVFRGSASPRPIFSVEREEYRANPDIVISGESGGSAVGDVKYKQFGGSAAAADIYQLLAHAEAFGASRAFLVFPGDSYFMKCLGAPRSGITTFLFAVRTGSLKEDLATLTEHLGYSLATRAPAL